MTKPKKEDYDFNDIFKCLEFANRMIKYVDFLEEKFSMYDVMPRLLLCMGAMANWDVTIGKKYKLIEETICHYILINDLGEQEIYNKDWFKKL